jgi:Coenzyme PQQ synthesis protein D (PqqD)
MKSEERFRVAAPEVIHQTIDGEVILVHLTRGTYHSLRGSGAFLFDPLVRGASIADLAAVLSAGTDGDVSRIEAAVSRFVQDLRRDGLIVTAVDEAGGDGAAAAPPASSTKQPFEEPRLETFTDLQDLLLTDPIHDVEPPGWPNVARGGPTKP